MLRMTSAPVRRCQPLPLAFSSAIAPTTARIVPISCYQPGWGLGNTAFTDQQGSSFFARA